MVAIHVNDLRKDADEVLRRLQETGEPIQIVDDGRTIATLVPADEGLERMRDEQTLAALAELDRLDEEIAASSPTAANSEGLIHDLRRDRDLRRGSTAADAAAKDAETAGIWSELERLSVEIGRRWPAGVTATEAVRDDRRDL